MARRRAMLGTLAAQQHMRRGDYGAAREAVAAAVALVAGDGWGPNLEQLLQLRLGCALRQVCVVCVCVAGVPGSASSSHIQTHVSAPCGRGDLWSTCKPPWGCARGGGGTAPPLPGNVTCCTC